MRAPQSSLFAEPASLLSWQARRTWQQLFGDSKLPVFESPDEWGVWAHRAIEDTETQVKKVRLLPHQSLSCAESCVLRDAHRSVPVHSCNCR
eukprot:Transcript_3238.p5 GENE.Transcript_3238~~Transcript_3238.p5  ORF type:complete len:92 (-),score=3.77 Transcript_3238:405-680(-)